MLSLLVTAASFGFLLRDAHDTDQRRLRDVVEFVVEGLNRRLDVYYSVLAATHSLFAASRQVGEDEFDAFVEAQEVFTRHPGIQGVGFARFIEKADLPAFVASVRETHPDFKVWPPGDRGAYSAIVYLAPRDGRNERATGYDMFSEPVRRAAMEEARDLAEIRASGRVTLVQERPEDSAQPQPGFLLYRAVYAGRADTVAERRRTLVGWVYSPFRAHDFIRAIFPEPNPAVDFEIFAGEPAEHSLLYDSDGVLRTAGGGAEQSRLTQRAQISVGGRAWTVVFHTLPAFEADSQRRLPFFVLLGGLLVSGLLFVLARWQTRARVAAEVAEERASFLANAGELLSKSLDYATTLRHVAELAVPSIGDWCSIDLKDEHGKTVNVATTHWDPSKVKFVEQLRAKYPPDPNAQIGAAQVIRSGRPILLSEIPAAVLDGLARDAEHRRLLHELSLASYMSVPLQSRDEAIGAISFATSDRERLYTREDLSLAQDLARLAAAAVENARLYRRAQELVQLRDDFLSIAAHELRTPLTSLRLRLQVMRRLAAVPDAPREKLIEAADGVERQTVRLARLVEGLLDMSRVGSDRLHIHLEEVDFAVVLREVAVRMKDEAVTAGSAVEVEAPPSFAGTSDLMRVEQVITNLLSNAIKYGGGKPIHLQLSGDDEVARIVVTDEGIGIAPEAVSRIFGRFERAVSVRHYGGLGLGLYITRQIVEALGGSIEVDTAEGRGSKFTVSIPRHTKTELAATERP